MKSGRPTHFRNNRDGWLAIWRTHAHALQIDFFMGKSVLDNLINERKNLTMELARKAIRTKENNTLVELKAKSAGFGPDQFYYIAPFILRLM